MADISNITIHGSTYNFKDTAARESLSGKADVASPEFTGVPLAPTAESGTNNTQIATTAFVMNAMQANDAMVFKGTLGSVDDGATVTSLPLDPNPGWTYKVVTAGTYSGKNVSVGDMLICITNEEAPSNIDWAVVQGNIEGTVISISVGAGLTGGPITTTGTIKADLTSEVKLENEAADSAEIEDRVYPVRLDKNGKLAVNVPWTDTIQEEIPDSVMVFKGTIGSVNDGATVTSLPQEHVSGWVYKVVTAGSYAGKTCEKDDLFICINTGEVSSNNDWTVIQGNLDKVVTGPYMAIENHVPVFSDSTGKILKDSGYTINASVPSSAKFTDTDTKVTSALNHYTPITSSGSDITKNASGGSAEWGIDVVKGVTLKTDGKGHVTGLDVVSGKIPSNPGSGGGSQSDTTYTLSQDPNDGHKITLTPSVGTATTITIPDNDTTYTSRVAIQNGTDVSLVTTGEKYAWNQKTSNTGTVTSVSAGAGLKGGPVTTTGTIKVDLTTEAKLTNAAADATETAGRVYPVRLDKDGKLAVNVPWTDTIQEEIMNSVIGPITAITEHIAVFSDTTGKKIKDSGYTISASVPQDAKFTDTDTKVTNSSNHYTPVTVSGSDITANAANAEAAWSIDVVKGITLKTDGKGHVTGLDVVSGKIPANPNVDSDTTYTLTQDPNDGHRITLTPSSGTAMTVTIPDNDTKYTSKTPSQNGTDVSLVTTGEKYLWNQKTTNMGTVTSVIAGAGLTGGTISTTGTIKVDLTSETKLTNAASDTTETVGRVYPVRLDKDGKLAVNVPWVNTDTVTSVNGQTGIINLGYADVGAAPTSHTHTKNEITDFPTFGEAAFKGVTDNATDVTLAPNDVNLITGRTLYNALGRITSDEINTIFAVL